MSKVVYQVQRNRESGTRIQVIDNRDGSFEADAGKEMNWITLCDTHGNYVGHSARMTAEEFTHHPTEWCQVCQEEGEARARQTVEQPKKDDTREIDEKVYFAVLESWAVEAPEIVRATDLDIDAVNRSLRRLQKRDLVESEHVNGEKALTWQTYFDIENDSDADIGARAAFNAAYSS